MRPEWDDVWMRVAQTVSARSLCSRAHIGAVIVSSDNRVQSASYNGPPPNFTHGEKPCAHWCPRASVMPGGPEGLTLDPGYNDCPASHAEINAIARADWSKLTGGTIYITGSVCYSCAKAIMQTNVARVVHVVHESDAHRDPDRVEEFLRSDGLMVVRYT